MLIIVYIGIFVNRPGSYEPTGRGVHQRAAPAEPHTTKDRGDGGGRSTTLRHLEATARLPRLRLQDPQPLPGGE